MRRNRRGGGGPTDRGFTLIEMIVVLAVLALVAGLVLSRGAPHSAALDMRQAAATVAGTLRAARARAVAANAPVAVLFDAQAGTLRLTGNVPGNVAGENRRTLPPGIGLRLIGGHGATVTFLPDGSSTGGRVDLAGQGRTAAVGIDWLTGRISVADAR